MSPDLNSLPPSQSPSMSSSPLQPRTVPIPTPQSRNTPSPRSSSVSLAAAASMNAADLSRRPSAGRGSPRLGRANERRRSIVALSLNQNDPSLPSPGELSSSDHRTAISHSFTSASPSSLGGNRVIADGDPHHQRAPSLGEIHQELEEEQEAQVNRMLFMIREQQLRLEQLQRGTHDLSSANSSQPVSATARTSSVAALDDLTPASERSFNLTSTITAVNDQPTPALPRTRSTRSTRHSSHSRSPALRPLPGHESSLPTSDHWPSLLETATVRRNSNSLRDESAYYQAETAMLTRENQMLRMRIRELERQMSETHTHGSLGSSQTNVPVVPSHLATNPPVEAETGLDLKE